MLEGKDLSSHALVMNLRSGTIGEALIPGDLKGRSYAYSDGPMIWLWIRYRNEITGWWEYSRWVLENVVLLEKVPKSKMKPGMRVINLISRRIGFLKADSRDLGKLESCPAWCVCIRLRADSGRMDYPVWELGNVRVIVGE